MPVYLGVAQLVARYLGVVEAAGSSPVTQKKQKLRRALALRSFCFFYLLSELYRKMKFTGADIFLAVIYLSEDPLDSNRAGGVFSLSCT